MADENTVAKPAAQEVGSAEHTRGGVYFRPNVDILEKSEELVVLADVPGATGDNIDVDFEDGMITLRDDGARKVLAGVTTIEEVLRVTHEDAG